MPNGRCNLHGGKSPGPPQGNKNARTTGIYEAGFTDEEREALQLVDLGTLELEIKVAAVQLRRALLRLHEIDNARGPESEASTGLELTELSQKKGLIPKGGKAGGHASVTTEVTVTKRRPDFDAIIDRKLRTLANLKVRHKQLTEGVGEGARELAAQVRQALDEMEESIGIE